MMKKLLVVAGIGVLISGLIGCSGMVQVEKEGIPEDAEMRTEYLKEHPGCIYAENISKGEVRGGMNKDEVKASWGLPNAIIVEDDIDNHYWVYYTKGSDTGSVLIYTLSFRDDRLENWKIEIKRLASYFVDGDGVSGDNKITLAGESKK
ncbi:MAG: hypothetical protein R6U43_01015 [Candidatus Krumholzibacteriales bacterium]